MYLRQLMDVLDFVHRVSKLGAMLELTQYTLFGYRLNLYPNNDMVVHYLCLDTIIGHDNLIHKT